MRCKNLVSMNVELGGYISYAFRYFSHGLDHEMLYWPAPVAIRVSSVKEHAALSGAAAEVCYKKMNRHESYSLNNHEI